MTMTEDSAVNDSVLAFFCGFGAGLFFALLLAIKSGLAARAERKRTARHIRELEVELDFAAEAMGLAKNRFAARLRDKLVEYADEPWHEEAEAEDAPGRIVGSRREGRLVRFIYGKDGQ